MLAITHEEIVALHASQTIRSYRDLPQIWYHIQLKERDEPRSSGGVLRTREFTMKDSYTLDRDQAGLDAAYAKHEEAYDRIYTRCGLEFYKVESDTGIMGGSLAHEFMAPSSAGEDRVARCSTCDYAANVEMAVSRIERPPSRERPGRRGRDARRGTIEELRSSWRRPAHDGQGHARDRGRRQGLAGARARRPPPARAQAQEGAAPDHGAATPEQIEAAFGAKPGSIGPVGIVG